jgi:SAM-dependent methyltransferase
MVDMTQEDQGRLPVREAVRNHYAKAALTVLRGGAGCCGEEACCDPITANLYAPQEVDGLPAEALQASLGCGNPTALGQLHEGEFVLDLGSGGGIDVLLSARRVGPTGYVYGLDMTDEMLELARANQRASGVANVEFLKGAIEDIPLPDASVDVVVSNCVINLSADKDRVFREAFRVLRSGGRVAVSDVVARSDLPETLRQDAALWSSCLGGALQEHEYRSGLERAGFVDVELEPTREFSLPGVGEFASMFVRAKKRPDVQ